MKNTRTSIAAKAAAYPAVVALTATLMAGPMATSNAAELPVQPGVTITNVSVDNRGDSNNDKILSVADRIFPSLSFTVPADAQPGDTWLVAMPEPFNALFDGTLPINTPDGTHIADAVVAPIPGQVNRGVLITLTDQVANLLDVTGSLEFPVQMGDRYTVAPDRTVEQRIPFSLSVNGTKVFDGDTYIVPAIREYTTWPAVGAKPNAAVPGAAEVFFTSTIGKSKQQRDITCTFVPTSSNWKFDPSKVRITSASIDQSAAVDEVPDAQGETRWETKMADAGLTPQLVSVSEKQVVVTVKGVPAGYAAQINLGGGAGTADGSEFKLSATCNSPGSIRDGETVEVAAAGVTISGLGEGVQIAPSFDIKATVAGKDADTAADAYKETLPNGTTSKALPYAVPFTNTGNVPIGSPTVTATDANGKVVFEKTYFDVSVPVGGSYTFDAGTVDTPVGTNTWTWTVTGGGAEASNPTVTVLTEQKIGDVIAKFVDQNGKDIKAPVTVADDANVGTDYDSTKHKVQTIPGQDGSRYELIKVTGAEKGKVTDGTTTITYAYQKVANWVPTIPGMDLPKVPYPFDPANPNDPGNGTIPHVDGYVPVDPATGEPLLPVDPNDPTKGYIAPNPGDISTDTPISYKALGDVIAKFVDQDGKEIAPSVTVSDDAVEGTAYDATGEKKDEIPGEDDSRYVLVATPENIQGEVAKGETVVTFTYQKVTNWVPTIPGMDLPKVPYPFDPENGVGEGTIPHVDDYVPVDPLTGDPLPFVDPEDPTKGYIAPKPGNPGEETVVSYKPIADPDTFVTEQGKPFTLTPSDNDGEGFKTIALIDPETGARTDEVTVPGEGVYTLNEDGTLTITPEPGFTGATTPILTVSVKDGVEADPVKLTGHVTPVGAPDTFETEEGKSIIITPSDNDGENTKAIGLVDEDGNTTDRLEFPGKGVVTLNEDGTLTIEPEPGFTGDFPEFAYIPGNDKGDAGAPVVVNGKVTPKPVVEEPKGEEPKGEQPKGETPAAPVEGPTSDTPAAPVEGQVVESAPQPAEQVVADSGKTTTPVQGELAYTGANAGIFAGVGATLLGLGAALTRRFRKEQ